MIRPTSLFDIAKTNNAIVGQGVVLLMDNVTPPKGTESLILWFKNTDPTLNYHLNKLVISVSPTASASPKPTELFVEARLRVATFQPTANFTVGNLVTMDSSSPWIGNGMFYTWNGTGTGMTTVFPGVYGGGVHLINGPFTFDFQGASVIAPGVSFGITIKTLDASSSTANVSLNLTGYYRDDNI